MEPSRTILVGAVCMGVASGSCGEQVATERRDEPSETVQHATECRRDAAPECGTSELPCDVSLVRLLGDPRRYADLVVRTQGVLDTGFENNLLYLDPSSLQAGALANSVVLALTPQLEQLCAAHRSKYVTVQGILKPSERESGFAEALIVDITRVDRVQ
jgi:hypothetical protein